MRGDLYAEGLGLLKAGLDGWADTPLLSHLTVAMHLPLEQSDTALQFCARQWPHNSKNKRPESQRMQFLAIYLNKSIFKTVLRSPLIWNLSFSDPSQMVGVKNRTEKFAGTSP